MIDGERYHVLPVPELQQEERHAARHSRRRQVPPQREQGPVQVKGPEAIVPIRIRIQWGKAIRISNRGLGKGKMSLKGIHILSIFMLREQDVLSGGLQYRYHGKFM
jgi:hypothetical protein